MKHGGSHQLGPAAASLACSSTVLPSPRPLCLVAVVSRSFLRRQRWARAALVVITALGLFASLMHLVVPAPTVGPAPPDAPAEYVQTLRLIAIADVVVPLAACLALGWILWRLQSPAVRDQFH